MASPDILSRRGGPLAVDLDDAAPDDFREWLVDQRADWEALAASAMARMSERAAIQPPPANEPDRIAWLREALRLDPLAEPLSRRLMLDLARMGDFASALAEYERLALALSGQLAIEPDGETVALHQRILAARSRGRRHNLPAEIIDPPSLGAVVQGRDDHEPAARLAAWLMEGGHRLVTLIGPPGSSRTRLARAASMLALAGLLDGVVWVPPAGGPEAATFQLRLAKALGDLDGVLPRAERIEAWLAPQERLIVLDIVDQEPGMAESLAAWVEAAPSVRWLVVSSEPLGLFFEHRFPCPW